MFLSVALTSCSSDDGGTPSGNNNNLFNKWWYSETNSTADLYFNSDGSYEQHFEGFNITSEGDWEWVNQNAKTMHVFNVTNNAADEFWYKFVTIGTHTMTVKISFDEGETWMDGDYAFVDTND